MAAQVPHNGVHGAVGYPLSDVPFASFHPLFFLLHCNVDRMYEAYLGYWGHEESEREFEATQRWPNG